MKAMLLCAGLGTRFKPQTELAAKPALPFLGLPILSYPLYYLEKLGMQDLVVNSHHLPQTLNAAVQKLTKNKTYKTRVLFEKNILGSGGGIANARSALEGKEDFLVANGDEVLLFSHDRGFAPLLEFHKKSNALATLLTTQHPQAGKTLGGVWVDSSGQITELGGTSPKPGAQHFTGVFAFSPRIFNYMPQSGNFHIFKDCLHKAMAAKEKVQAFHDAELLWLDVTSLKDYIHSSGRALQELQKESPFGKNLLALWKHYGVTCERKGDAQWLGKNASCAGKLKADSILFLSENARIGADVEINGFAVLGPDAHFDQGYIESSVIGEGVHVHSLEAIRNQLIL